MSKPPESYYMIRVINPEGKVSWSGKATGGAFRRRREAYDKYLGMRRGYAPGFQVSLMETKCNWQNVSDPPGWFTVFMKRWRKEERPTITVNHATASHAAMV